MKRLPIGKQHLELFAKQNLLYVDKTPLIYKLVEEANYYFLSRPRRFGKSLLVDTLRNIFLGNQHLFEGLWIYDKIEWKEYPVIHLDFSALSYRNQDLDKVIGQKLKQVAESYQLTIKGNGSKELLIALIEQLSETAPVVLLIDEYDSPITDYIDNLEQANINREILREFYGGLKFLGNKLRLVFITGIAKFARVSLFSVLNNLTDLSMNIEYANICGITPDELTFYFKDYIQKTAEQSGLSETELLSRVREMYNGYSWDGENFVYNPFSLLNFFHEGRFRSYWFKTGTPTFLINILRAKRAINQLVESIEVHDSFFDRFNIQHGLAIEPLLFQTGYLTAKSVRYEATDIYYTLDFPNKEVKQAFLHNLLEAYTFKEVTTINVATIKLRKALENQDIEGIHAQLNVLFADLSYHFNPFEKKDKDQERAEEEFKAWEGYFHAIIYLVLQYIGVHIRCEVSKQRGRLDAIIEVSKCLYIVEFKLEDAVAALQQIKKQGYAESYINIEKPIILMGIAFDQQKRIVKPIQWEFLQK